MGILDKIISLAAPHACLACAAEGALLCRPCITLLTGADERCYKCQCAAAQGVTCYICLQSTPLIGVRAATAYKDLAKQLVSALKFKGAKPAAQTMARLMMPLVSTQHEKLVVPVPTATSRVRQRGYDQAYLIAGQLSKLSELPVVPCLVRQGQLRQVGATRNVRLQQGAPTYRVTKTYMVKNADILLIDDVVTTGATFEAAATALRAAGARHIEALAFAQSPGLK